MLHWTQLERMIPASADTSNVSLALKATRETTLLFSSLEQERLHCLASATKSIARAFGQFNASAQELSTTQQGAIFQEIDAAEHLLRKNRCETYKHISLCAQRARGSREHIRLAFSNIQVAISKQIADLRSKSSTLTPDDWHTFHNVITAQMLLGVELGLKAVTASSSCTTS
jgi:hypothetical protein